MARRHPHLAGHPPAHHPRVSIRVFALLPCRSAFRTRSYFRGRDAVPSCPSSCIFVLGLHGGRRCAELAVTRSANRRGEKGIYRGHARVRERRVQDCVGQALSAPTSSRAAPTFSTTSRPFRIACAATKTPSKLTKAISRRGPKSADREHVAESRIDVLRAAIEARKRAELDAEIEARKAAIDAAARVKAERPLTAVRRDRGRAPGSRLVSGWRRSGDRERSSSGSGSETKRSVESVPAGSSYSMVQEMADRGPRRTKAGVALMSRRRR